MGDKMCNTINQNIEPNTEKVYTDHFKQFGTLLNARYLRNDLSQISMPNHYNMITNLHIDDSQKPDNANDKPDTEFYKGNSEGSLSSNYNVWNQKKIADRKIISSPDELALLRRMESNVNILEPLLQMCPSNDVSCTFPKIRRLIVSSPPPTGEDTLSDVDLDKFDTSQKKSTSISCAIDEAETLSLSNFHNVRDVLLNIRARLESYLKTNRNDVEESKNANFTDLEGNIFDFKRELDNYVQIIDERCENELRKFSENLANQFCVRKMHAAFSSRRKDINDNIYETINYSSADNSTICHTLDYPIGRQDGFTMRNCYDNNYTFETNSPFSSEEYYTMLIHEQNIDGLLKDAPPPEYNKPHDKISLIFRDPENVIKQWQNYQLQTIKTQLKGDKTLKFKLKTAYKGKIDGIWGFTLDHHQNEALQERLRKERRLRIICRSSFYFFSLVCFILVVLVVRSLFKKNLIL